MESIANLRFARISAQKARLVADLVRGESAGRALDLLAFLPKKGAPLVRTLLESAVANAEHAAGRANRELDIDQLYIKRIEVNAGPSMRRFRPRAQGRATPILKKTSHIILVVDVR